ncbi:MAG: hypothetical protein EXS55_04150 [Candidatus Magasanikbacteria bacterium]|nr:hypothetical protein [Candidatus Magasanikbacteria bacterium]
MSRLKSVLCLLVGLFVMFGIFGFFVSANAFTITPARLTVTATGGVKIIVKITASNPDSLPFTITPQVVGVKQDEAGRTLRGRAFDEAESWVTPETAGMVVPPGEKRDIFFAIAPPSGTAPGSHYVGLALAATPADSGTVQLTGELVALLTIHVAGTVNEQLEIIDWKIPRFITPGRAMSTTVVARNTGTIEVPVVGQFRITTLGGREIFSEPLPLGNKIVPGSTRRLTPSIMVRPAMVRPGPYWAELQIAYGITRQVAARSSLVWYVPWWSVGCLSVLAVGLIALIIRVRR